MSRSTQIQLADANEWYTPRQYIDAARLTMGGIDLDPASCAEANSIVGATRYYSTAENGLAQPWTGRVFLNPPYLSLTGNAGQYPAWTRKLVDSFELGFVEQAILLIPVHPERRWFQPLYRYSICFCNHQPQFHRPGRGNAHIYHGLCFVYLGQRREMFAEQFSAFGNILQCFRPAQTPAELWQANIPQETLI